MTFDEARDALGLLPFDEFLKSPKRLGWIKQMETLLVPNDAKYVRYRATGKTTSMLLQAMVYLSEHPGETIYITGCSPAYSRQLCFQAKDYAYRLGLDPDMIKPRPRRRDNHGCGPENNVFYDHY